jgi:hypothetical protein
VAAPRAGNDRRTPEPRPESRPIETVPERQHGHGGYDAIHVPFHRMFPDAG